MTLSEGITAQYHTLNKQFKKYKIQEINSSTYVDAIENSRNDILNTTFQGIELQMYRSDIISPDFTSSFSDESGQHRSRIKTAVPMKGSSRDGGLVSLTFNDNFIYGFYEFRSRRYYIEPLYHFIPEAFGSDQYIIYEERDVINDTPRTCGVIDEHNHAEKMKSDIEHFERMPGQCLEVDYAIANDFSMFTAYGGVAGVENHAIGVTNNVQTNYDNEFSDEIQFVIVTHFVPTSAGSDPFPSTTDAGTLLSNFRGWGNGGGFGATYDVASLWTQRNITFNGSSGVVGLAYVGVICGNSRYNLLEDYTSSAWQKRVLVAHELGHNFDGLHDSGGGFIMSPFVNNSNIWSAASISDIENHIASRWCLATCSNSSAPVADFDWTYIEDCAPGLVQFEDLSTGTVTAWDWDFPGGTPNSSTSQNPQITYNTSGVYDVTLTVFNGALSNTYTVPMAIEIFDQPTADFTYSINLSEVTFTNLSQNGNSYFWDFGDGNTSTLENPIHNYAEDGVYTVILFVDNDCGQAIWSESFTIATPPTAGFSGNPRVGCNAHVVSFTENASSNSVNFFWEFEGGIPNTSTEENPVVQYDTAGIYNVKLTVTNPQGNNTLEEVNYITVNPTPIADFSFTQNGAQVTFTNESTAGSSYSWDFGDGATSMDENPIHNYTSSGIYIVTLETSNPECGTNTVSDTVSVILEPQALIGVNGSPIGCTPFDVQFEDQSTSNPTSWQWTFEGGTPNTSTIQNPMVNYSSSGNYDVTLIATNNVGSDTLTLFDFIQVNTVPTANFVASQLQGVVTFTNFSMNADNYEWDFGDGTTSNEENPVHDYGGEGTWTVVLTSYNECGSFSQTQNIETILSPIAAFGYDPDTTCAGNPVSFMDNSQNTITSRTWTFEGGNPATSSDANPVVTYDMPGTYSVTLEVSNIQGTDTEVIMNAITILDEPTASYTVSQDLNQITYTYTGNPNDAIEWLLPDGSTSTEMTVTFIAPTNGDYSATLAVSNICGADIAEILSSINAYPDATIFVNNQEGCAPLTTTFSAPEIEGASYSWVVDGGNPSSSNEREVIVEYTARGSYDVILTVSNSLGSETNTLTDAVKVFDIPISQFSSSYDGVFLTVDNTSQFADSYDWDFGDGTKSQDENPTHQYQEDGTYTITLITSNECGTDTFSVSTDVEVSVPGINFTTSIREGCVPLEVIYTDMSSNDPTSYEWVFEGGTPATSTDPNPVITYNSEGVFDVSVTMTNTAGNSTAVFEDHIIVKDLPAASFDINSPIGGAVSFTNTTPIGAADSYLWDFGDGTTSNEDNPTHTYTTSGTFTVILTAMNDCGSKDYTDEVEITISNIEEISVLEEFAIYPNPFTESINLKAGFTKNVNAEVEISDQLGRKVKSLDFYNQKLINNQIDLSNIPKGVYILKLKVQNEFTQFKLVKS
jgi:PKD repeat protein